MTRSLAIGIDAAEPSFVSRCLERGELPNLRRLLGDGVLRTVTSPAPIGSGTVWPTFMTGLDAGVHGVHSEWSWQPATMSLERCNETSLPPFWQSALAEGRSVGLLDIPFAPFLGVADGFEISEWGAHDSLNGRMRFSPPDLADRIEAMPAHPFTASGGDDVVATIEGVRLRGRLAATLLREISPDLSIIVFPEMHHASHLLWHTAGDSASPLASLLHEIDAQIGTLVAAAAAERVIIFSLHGMRTGGGAASLLQPLLVERGYSMVAGWSSQSWSQRALSLFGRLKRRTPPWMKRLYYRSLPPETTLKLAQPTMLPGYDWSRTRAFALPSDQHGWIRINLEGRESRGIVPPSAYPQLCAELEESLRGLRDQRDQPLVHDVVRTSEAPLTNRLPDLVVHWTDAALTPLPSGKQLTGQHAPNGFLIACGVDPGNDPVEAAELHRLL